MWPTEDQTGNIFSQCFIFLSAVKITDVCISTWLEQSSGFWEAPTAVQMEVMQDYIAFSTAQWQHILCFSQNLGPRERVPLWSDPGQVGSKECVWLS